MAKPKEIPEKTNDSNDFLLAEYARLADFQKSATDTYQRRFDIYLAVFSAAVVGFLALSDPSSSLYRETILYVILVSLIIVGVTIFASMASISTWQVHLERAMRKIQERFTQNDPSMGETLYFSTRKTGIPGTGFFALLLRGIISGGPKTILVIGNSIAISYLLVLLITSTNLISSSQVTALVAIGLVTFLLSSSLHVLFARIMYKIGGI